MFANGVKKCKALSGFDPPYNAKKKNIYFYIQIWLQINQVTKLVHNSKIFTVGLG
jgi:hypothetical protein